ncbi:hypothetical protein [Virgisporangium aurantiacum]|uniref:Uncharacterized protein n=1 Tax=Virgisporangium aurantiacum TaxID=175570 RepID=A0A8J3ZFV5_9ACTN|nr:hypothetical protein [Virgisporangium aurantiacum]GIJ63362.1 hypothetical protein Vau01_108780 [Virgisporangium aurantiacum]
MSHSLAFQPFPTKLYVQQGPSCWLYVVEAVAAARATNTGRTTRYLRMVMNAYPSQDDVERALAAHAEPKPAKRTLALQLTAANLSNMVAALATWRDGEGGRRAGGQISKDLVERYARQNSCGGAVEFLKPVSAWPTPVAGIIAEFTAATDRANRLVQLAAEGTDEAHALLNTGAMRLGGPKQRQEDTHAALCNASVPCYARIGKRFKLLPTDTGAVADLTGRDATTMDPTTHAVLLHGYDAVNQVVTYKDPNYGDIEIKVTLAQFANMHRGEDVELLSFFSSGVKCSRLAEVLD